jgi:hypothetical protein
MVKYLAVLAVVGLAVPALANPGDILVGDPFLSGYNGWTDVSEGPQAGVGPANWGINMVSGALQESSDGYTLAQALATATGPIKPYLMVNSKGDYTIPSSYSVGAQIVSYDDDGVGLVFGYQDSQNYWRVGLRSQSTNPAGMGQGIWVANVKNGVETRYGPTSYAYPVSTSAVVTPFNLSVKVDEVAQTYQVYVDGTLKTSGTATVDNPITSGKAGVMSWYQKGGGSAAPAWGTEVRSFSIKDAADTAVFQDSFNSNASPAAWRNIHMVQTSAGSPAASKVNDIGDFRFDFRNGTVSEDTNGNVGATSAAPHANFTGPAVVVNSPGSSALANYEMKTRIANHDNDGVGVLVRVQDDKNFYRVNFISEATGAGDTRPYQGLSVQKCLNGTWTNLFTETSPLFVFTADDLTTTAIDETVPFDVSVKVMNNEVGAVELLITVWSDQDHDGTMTMYEYPMIVDSSNPLLAGTAGFASWGNGGTADPATWSVFGGVAGTPLITEIVPEPVTMGLFGVFGAAMLLRRRRNAQA